MKDREDDGFGAQVGDEDFGSLLAEYEKAGTFAPKRGGPQPGDAVKGRIVSIGKESVLVDLGLKSEGILALPEVQDDDGKVLVEVGQEIEAKVAQVDGRRGSLILRYRLGRGAVGADELSEAFANGVPVQGTVTGVNKGGVEVQVSGVRAFCPISQLDLKRTEDATPFIGQKLTFRITKLEPGPRGRIGNLVLSRRKILEEESRRLLEEARARLKEGDVVRGKVTQLRDYGAFVDLGGVEGMLHVSEIGFARVTRASDALTVGQEVEVQILRIERGDDPKRGDRISLSLKSLAKDPWDDVPQRFAAGTRTNGKVVRVESFGAFVELEPGIEGLLHVSELGQGKQIRHAREAARIGQTFELVVRELDVERRRISLELADVEEEGGRAYAASLASASLDEGPRDTLGDLLRSRKPGA
ncbi:MAG: S1 RNA-binding domain-containing protein [Deltaproteobacteria bacterium]|nr:S1 RNA-binding domain-containing protein [Deltaproteobacteria bacterium]